MLTGLPLNETCRNGHSTHSGDVVLSLYAASPIADIQERNIQTAFLSNETKHTHTQNQCIISQVHADKLCVAPSKNPCLNCCFSGVINYNYYQCRHHMHKSILTAAAVA